MTWSPPEYKWKLVYYDWTEFTNFDGEPDESPEIGLVLVLQPGLDYDILRDVSNYLYDEDLGRWVSFDDKGLSHQLTRNIRRYSCYREGWQVPVKNNWREIRDHYVYEVRGK